MNIVNRLTTRTTEYIDSVIWNLKYRKQITRCVEINELIGHLINEYVNLLHFIETPEQKAYRKVRHREIVIQIEHLQKDRHQLYKIIGIS